MASTSVEPSASIAEQRKPIQATQQSQGSTPEPNDGKKRNKIYGKTPNGTVFVVPETEDMVTNLLDPRVPKSISDYLIVSVLSAYIALYVWLPKIYRVPVFILLFGFWRMSYNAGIGWLLSQQSTHKQLTKWALEYKIFEKSNSFLHRLIRKDLSVKLDSNEYDFYKAPLEYNTWLLFRDLVDLILMSDFTCYMLLAFSCASAANHSWFVVVGRWSAGIVLFLFNLWVKLDAHRVVKDYAWYWGDFFFLEEVELTFDGVFEMAPHPMYSIGYAGFYGISLMAASYTLFFVSALAHAAQFAFLIIVENPHIEKTYSSPEPKKKPASRKSSDSDTINSSSNYFDHGEGEFNHSVVVDDNFAMRSSRPALLMFHKGFDITRSTDIFLILVAFYSSLLYLVPRSGFWYFVTLTNALLWRLFHNGGLGFLLHQQSESKAWTRIFLKFGRSTLEAYEQWQILYNLSTVMSYINFGVFALREWESPIGVPFWPFRYILGMMMICLQLWTSYSIFESLGEYGWFFADFFFPQPQKLTYSGIYRYLNNPERLFGIAGVWGAALITNSMSVIFLAFMWTFGGMAFIKFVEQPHMQKLYGGQLREEAGVTKTIRQVAKLPTPLESRVRKLQGSIDKVISETANAVEGFLNQAKPKFSSGVKDVVNETKVLLKQYPARLTIIRVSDEISVNQALYSLKIISQSDEDSLRFELGETIKLSWTADKDHSKKDWIGLYRITDSSDKEVTRISSRGRWTAISKGSQHNDDEYDNEHTSGILVDNGNSGEVVFSGPILFWEKGVYEFRYHHDGKHNVLAVSQAFEIYTESIEITGGVKAVAETLLPLVQRCFRGSGLATPESINNIWDLEDNRYVAQRLSYGIKHSYSVDLAPAVFKADETVLQLAQRLINVKNALKPFVEIERERA